MNRAQRRKQKVTTKEPSYNFTMKQLNEYVKNEVERYKAAVQKRQYSTIFSIFFTALAEEFGFGETRLKRLKEKTDNLFQEMITVDDYGDRMLTFQDMSLDLKEKYGIEIDPNETFEADKANESMFRSSKKRCSIEAVHTWLETNGYQDAADDWEEFIGEAWKQR